MDEKHPVSHMLAVVVAWFATVQLAQIQTFVAIVSGLLVAVYTGLRIYFLLKNKKDEQ